MVIIETERLLLREWTQAEAPFLLELLHTPGWLRFIGDRGVRNLADAQKYISDRFVQSYQTWGFGLYLVVLKENMLPIGTCGLVKRDTMEDVDIGFALMPTYTDKGYAYEAAQATLTYARTTLNMKRLVAITLEDNTKSIRLLEKIGLSFERKIKPSSDAKELLLFAT